MVFYLAKKNRGRSIAAVRSRPSTAMRLRWPSTGFPACCGTEAAAPFGIPIHEKVARLRATMTYREGTALHSFVQSAVPTVITPADHARILLVSAGKQVIESLSLTHLSRVSIPARLRDR